MKLGPVCLQSAVIALALAGIFAAPLRAQVAPPVTAPAAGAFQTGLAQQTGVAPPASDLVPVVVMFTGPGEWDIIGVSGGPAGSGSAQGLVGGAAQPSAIAGPAAQRLSRAGSATPQRAINPQAASRIPLSPPPSPAFAAGPLRAGPGAVPAGARAQPATGNPRPASRIPQSRPPDFVPFLF